nr:putative capsid [Marmot picobirnavirus]
MAKKSSKNNNKNYKNDDSYRGRESNSQRRDRDGKARDYDKTAMKKDSSKYGNGYCGKENDPSWYNKLRTLIQDVTKIPFGYQVGRDLDFSTTTAVSWEEDLGSESQTIFETAYDRSTPPGVMALDYMCVPGIAKDANDGVNIAAVGLFQNIRKNLSTVASYAPADVMMYILACDSLLTLYNVILRDFGLINLYSSLNYNYNKSLFVAQNWRQKDIVDLISNYSIYRSRFNNLIYKASTIFIPNSFSILDRHAWLFSNVFIDSVSPKAQIYVHNMRGFYLLDEQASDQGTALTWNPIEKFDYNDEGHMMEALLNAFAFMIESIRNSDSMNKIAADMARAFPDVGSWKLAYCDENYTVLPTYSKEVLSQIENTTILPYDAMSGLNITQSVDKNIILFDPMFSTSKTDEIANMSILGWSDNNLINMHWDNPSSDDVAVATRNMVNLYKVVPSGSAPTQIFHMQSCGSDICVGARLIKYNTSEPNSDEFAELQRFMAVTATPSAAQSGSGAFMSPRTLSDYVSFDWAPIIYVCMATPDTYDTANPSLYGAKAMSDYDNYTLVSPELLNTIHSNVIASMWNVPQLGDVQI